MQENPRKFYELFEILDSTLVIGGLPDIYRKYNRRSPKYQRIMWVIHIVETLVYWYIVSGEAIMATVSFHSKDTFNLFVESAACSIFSSCAWIKLMNVVLLRKEIQEVVHRLELIWPTHVDTGDLAIIDEVIGSTKSMLSKVLGTMTALAFTFNAFPAVVMFIRFCLGKDLILLLPFKVYYPFDPYQNLVVYCIIYAFNVYAGLFTRFALVVADWPMFVMISHLETQFKLLCKAMDTVFEHAEELSEEDKYEVELERVKGVIKRHTEMIELTGNVRNIFSLSILVNMLHASILNCFLLFSVLISAPTERFKYAFFVLYTTTEIFTVCWFSDKLKYASNLVREAAYTCTWYMGDVRLRKYIDILMSRTMTDESLSAMGFSDISMTSFTAVMKVTWSYFTLLRTTYQKIQ